MPKEDIFTLIMFTREANNANAPITLCRLGFPTRPDFEVGISQGSVCLSQGELGIRRVSRIGREGTRQSITCNTLSGSSPDFF